MAEKDKTTSQLDALVAEESGKAKAKKAAPKPAAEKSKKSAGKGFESRRVWPD